MLDLPDTPLARRVHAHVAAVLPAHLYHHSVRGYLFARALAGADVDAELLFLICALHDVGLVHSGTVRFEVAGADRAAELLETEGAPDDRIDAVWDAIALRTGGFTESPVWRRRRPRETWLAIEGIGIDVGGGPELLPDGYADRVHAAYPRLGGTPALLASIERHALANPGGAFPGTLAGELVRQRHPELPYLTWDGILAASSWDR